MIATLIKVVVAVGLSAVLFIGANVLFDQAYARWTLFNTIIGAVTGFVAYLVLEANGAFRTLFEDRVNILNGGPWDINIWLWAIVGGAAGALVMFLLSAPRQALARLPLAIIGFAGFGVLTALAFNDETRPAIDFNKVLICVVIGVVALGLIGLAARRHQRWPESALSPAPASAGSSGRGAAATSATATSPASCRHRRPGRHPRPALRPGGRAVAPTAPSHRAEGRGRGSSSCRPCSSSSPASSSRWCARSTCRSEQ